MLWQVLVSPSILISQVQVKWVLLFIFFRRLPYSLDAFPIDSIRFDWWQEWIAQCDYEYQEICGRDPCGTINQWHENGIADVWKYDQWIDRFKGRICSNIESFFSTLLLAANNHYPFDSPNPSIPIQPNPTQLNRSLHLHLINLTFYLSRTLPQERQNPLLGPR